MTTIARVEDFDADHLDPTHVQKSREKAGELLRASLPARYRSATVDELSARKWVSGIVAEAVATGHPVPKVECAPSLLFLGTVGSGKTWTAFGIIRALSASGLRLSWEAVTAADFYAAQRGSDHPEAAYQRYARTPLLLLDDLGAEKTSEWTEQQLYRLINHRYTHMLPMLITTNLPAAELRPKFGDRIASRIGQMCHQIELGGHDRREPAGDL
ncbi:ATP-binding protein [Actinoalloteichus sp. GBA129-24]|uniref:ATP-binding protein n=1 Tax=Actinoalloteichus sp. GBA129-24 TaxID=1612551 RepID=UPI00095051E5|nr:ATP-binding protein [Actinoalloteichus sp. GBA129-24]APU20901.1 DNA replication protein [Actinoalloteichus sp. GBA129-24]APU24150.1 DNA replication protein [Actinoalloteichus sp. GBA129-24]